MAKRGRKWVAISRDVFPGRSKNSVRNRFRLLAGKVERRRKKSVGEADGDDDDDLNESDGEDTGEDGE